MTLDRVDADRFAVTKEFLAQLLASTGSARIFQHGHVPANLFEPSHDRVVSRHIRRRLLRDETDRPTRLEDRRLYLIERREPLPVRRRLDLGPRNQLTLAVRRVDLAVCDEHVGRA